MDFANSISIPNFDDVKDLPVKVSDVKKIEERLCYDAYWHIYTDYGILTIKTLDGISYNDMLSRAKNCNTLSNLLELRGKNFYYD